MMLVLDVAVKETETCRERTDRIENKDYGDNDLISWKEERTKQNEKSGKNGRA